MGLVCFDLALPWVWTWPLGELGAVVVSCAFLGSFGSVLLLPLCEHLGVGLLRWNARVGLVLADEVRSQLCVSAAAQALLQGGVAVEAEVIAARVQAAFLLPVEVTSQLARDCGSGDIKERSMGMIIGAAVVLLVCAGVLGYVSLRGNVPLYVATAALMGIFSVVVLVGLAREGLLDALLGREELAEPVSPGRAIALFPPCLAGTFVLQEISLAFAGLLMRWGVPLRPAPESPVAQRVRELRGRLSWVVVETVQEDFLVPRQVIEELLRGAS